MPPTVTRTPTVTPEPYLYIELTIQDAETGEAVAAEVHLGLLVDDNSLGYPLEQNVSETTIELPRDIMRADAVYINVIADGYLNRLMQLPPEAKTAESVTIEVLLEKLTK